MPFQALFLPAYALALLVYSVVRFSLCVRNNEQQSKDSVPRLLSLPKPCPERGSPERSRRVEGGCRRLNAPAAFFLAGGIALALFGPTEALPAPASTHIAIIDFAFEPAEQTITSGDIVTWHNDGTEPHNVIDADGTWESPTLLSGQTYAFTFATPGTYTYFCSIHSGMIGTIIVAEPQPPQTKLYIPTIQR